MQNSFFRMIDRGIRQFDEHCQKVKFNFWTSVISTYLGSWIWYQSPDIIPHLSLGYLSGIIGFYFSNILYSSLSLVAVYLIERMDNHDEQVKQTTLLIFKILNRLASFIVAFGVSDSLLGISGVNTMLVFLSGSMTALLLVGLAAGFGWSEYSALEPGTPI